MLSLLRIILLLSSFIFFLNSCEEAKAKRPLLIASASNVQFVLTDLVEAFQKTSGIDCEVISTSSGKLFAQIKAGAEYDIFISADQNYPEILYQERLTESPPVLYASGRLMAWSMQHELDPNHFDIAHPDFKKIAIANPQIAPYGKAAMEYLTSKGVLSEIESRLVYGESISQVNQFVNLGAADLGLTGQGVIFRKHNKAEGSYLYLPDSLYSPINQDVVSLKNGNATRDDRKAFIDFLLGREGKKILGEYGYE